MNEFFKYEYGYVNVDTENLYLTNSGNWSETKTLSEKGNGGNISQNIRRIRIIAFFVIVAVLFLIFFISKLRDSKLFLGLPIAGYFLYRYLRNEMGAAFYIPIHKIESIEKIGKDYKLCFRNSKNETDTVSLNNVEEKGELIIQSLNIKPHS